MARKRVTVDQLATMVANGFQALQEEMREGFQRVISRLEEVEARLSENSTTLNDHSRHLGRVERKLDSTTDLLDSHGVRLARLEERHGS
jgi:hypothetical protein